MNDDTNLNITFTQIASCGVGKPSTEIRRMSLRAKLEAEKEEAARRRGKSFIGSVRNLFGASRS